MNTEENLSRRNVFVERLTKEYGYPKDSIRVEVPFSYGKARYRLDIVVYVDGSPYIVVEIKKNWRHKRILDQIRVRSSIGNTFAVITDGYKDSCFRILRNDTIIELVEIPDIPIFGKSLTGIGAHEYSELIRMGEQRFKVLIWDLLRILRGRIASPLEALRVLSSFLLAKVYDEDTKSGLFRVGYDEDTKIVKNRILSLFEQSSRQYPGLDFALDLEDEIVMEIVHAIQKFALRKTTYEGYSFNLLFDDFLKEVYGEFYTPKAISRLMIGLINPGKGATMVDPACGFGGLIVEAALKGCDVTGFEIYPKVAQIAQINLLLSDISGEIHPQDSLQRSSMENNKSRFDYVAVVPPFGKAIRDNRLYSFELGQGRKSQRIESLFVELALTLVKPNGRIAILVPDGILFSSSSHDVRRFIYRKAKIKALISLPESSFIPYSNVRTSLLILEKKDDRESEETDSVFVTELKELQKTQDVVSEFIRFEESNKLEESEDLFLLNIQSPMQLDIAYLKGLHSLKPLDLSRTIELGKIADINTGIKADRLGIESSDGDFIYLRAGDVSDLSIDVRNAKQIKVTRDASRWEASAGDILLTRAGTVGRIAMVQDDVCPLIFGENLVRIHLRETTRVLPEYLLSYLLSNQGKRQIEMFTGGSTIRSVNVSGLRKLKIPLIPIEKQREIGNELKRILRAKSAAESMLKEAQSHQEDFLINLENRIRGG